MQTYYQQYYARNREKRKIETRDYFRNVRLVALEALGGKCVKCGFDDYRALQIDHVGGGGSRERKAVTRSYYTMIVESILKDEGKYQLLCANCNWIKRVENSEIRKG